DGSHLSDGAGTKTKTMSKEQHLSVERLVQNRHVVAPVEIVIHIHLDMCILSRTFSSSCSCASAPSSLTSLCSFACTCTPTCGTACFPGRPQEVSAPRADPCRKTNLWKSRPRHVTI